jgi:Tol biopolymer transport system component
MYRQPARRGSYTFVVLAWLRRGIVSCSALLVAGLLVGSPGAGARGEAKPIGKIVFTAAGADLGDSNIYTVHADGSHFRKLTNTPNVYEQSPSWAPDGKSFVYVKAEGNGSLYRMKAGGGKPRLLFKGTGSPGAIVLADPHWSPDGRRIAFARASNTWTIWTYGPAGRLTEVTHSFSVHPTWSPNGRQIAYDSQAGISIVGFRGGRPRLLAQTSQTDSDPVWSPYGKWIALKSLNANWQKHEVDSLVLVNPAGTVRKLLLSGGRLSPQSWSPTSDAVLVSRGFGKPPDTRSQLYIVPLDGGRLRPVDGTNGGGGASWHR